jgi:hypothetical protein
MVADSIPPNSWLLLFVCPRHAVVVAPRRHPARQEVRELLSEAQAAFKLLLDGAREKEAEGEAMQRQADKLRGAVEALRQEKGEVAAALQVGALPGRAGAAPAPSQATTRCSWCWSRGWVGFL